MNNSLIQIEIITIEKISSKCESKIQKLEEELEHLQEFKSRYSLGIDDFNNNLNNRKKRTEIVERMSQNIKCGQAYAAGMNEDLTGQKHNNAMDYIEKISYRIEIVIRKLEEEIEELRTKMKNCRRKIEELNVSARKAGN